MPATVDGGPVTSLGQRYVTALSEKDTAALKSVFAPQVDFKGMTPGRFWEATTPDEIIDVLYHWFDEDDHVEAIELVEVGRHVDRERLDFRLQVRNSGGLFRVEQRAYYDLDADGRVEKMNVMCSGFRAISPAPG